MTSVIAVLRPLRTEIFLVAGAALLIALAAGGVALRLFAFDIPDVCFSQTVFDAACVSRQIDLQSYSDFAAMWGGVVSIAVVVLPSGAGLILGIAAVGKELDQRTTVLAWSLSPSRRRWLLQRLAPLAVVVVLTGLEANLVVQAMFDLHRSGQVGLSFDLIPLLGLAPAVEGLSAFGIGLVVGAMLGRLLPALLASVAFAIFGFMVVTQANERLMNGESIIVEQAALGPEWYTSGKFLDQMVRLADGRIISSDQVYPDYADPNTGELLPGNTQLMRFVPIQIYPEVAARFLVLQLVVAAMTLTLGVAVTDRRAP